MEIIEVATGLRKGVVISEVETQDWKMLTKKRYSFAWQVTKETAVVYKLHIEDDEDILGVMALVDVPDEKRIEIKLLSTAYACRQAVYKYKSLACISLVPKTELIKHYSDKYYMRYAGWQLYLEGSSMRKLLKEYL